MAGHFNCIKNYLGESIGVINDDRAKSDIEWWGATVQELNQVGWRYVVSVGRQEIEARYVDVVLPIIRFWKKRRRPIPLSCWLYSGTERAYEPHVREGDTQPGDQTRRAHNIQLFQSELEATKRINEVADTLPNDHLHQGVRCEIRYRRLCIAHPDVC